MRASLLLIGALALAGCQSAAQKRAAETGEIEAANASPSEISGLMAAARDKHAMEPGSWQVGMELVSADLSSMPPEQRMRQEAALQQQLGSRVQCAGKDDLKPVDVDLLTKAAGECVFERFVLKGGRVEYKAQCTNGPATIGMAASGTLSSTGFDVTIDQTTGAPGQPNHTAVKLRTTGKRIGACPAG
jgi:hypothetical protein